MPTLDPIPEHVRARRRRIGRQIRDAREGVGMTQERLGELTDLSRVTIWSIETGTASPRLDHLLMIADALGTPLSHLVRE